MTPADAFPLAMAVLDVVAAVAYGLGRDWPRVVYWLAAAVLTVSTVWMRR